MGFYENFYYLCENNHKDKGIVCKECGLSQGIHSKWKNGVTPKIDAVIAIAKYFNVSVDYILTNKDFSFTLNQQNLLNDFELLSDTNKQLITQHIQALIDLQENEDIVTIKHSLYKVSAGFGEALYDADNFEDIKIRNSDIAQIADFALTVYGDSMIPKFYPDDIILIKQQDSVDIGDICVYTVQNEGFIKKFGGDRLISLNPKYPDVIFEDYSVDEIRCCGLVLGKAQKV